MKPCKEDPLYIFTDMNIERQYKEALEYKYNPVSAKSKRIAFTMYDSIKHQLSVLRSKTKSNKDLDNGYKYFNRYFKYIRSSSSHFFRIALAVECPDILFNLKPDVIIFARFLFEGLYEIYFAFTISKLLEMNEGAANFIGALVIERFPKGFYKSCRVNNAI